jgi:predicted HTH transcriptional regulator
LQNFDQFPADALEEGIVNALVHRDYALTTTIWCKLYLDAFVVENPGRILQPDRQVPENFTLQNYQLVPNPRNSKLVEWIQKLRNNDGKPFVKGISEGTRKMRKLMEEMYFPYPSYQTNGVTKMTLQSVATPEELEEGIRKRRFIF